MARAVTKWGKPRRRKKAAPAAGLPQVDIVQAMLDKSLLGAGFGDPKTWQQWQTVLKGVRHQNLTAQKPGHLPRSPVAVSHLLRRFASSVCPGP